MRSAQETNRKTDVIVSAPVLTQRQTQLVHTINKNFIIIMSILGVLNYLIVKTMYLSKPFYYQMQENPNSDYLLRISVWNVRMTWCRTAWLNVEFPYLLKAALLDLFGVKLTDM